MPLFGWSGLEKYKREWFRMKLPLISIIVPVYNTAPWLRRCLDSICAQSYRNLEILCVNDGSTDNSAEILAEYAARDSRIKVIYQPNAGLAAARNTGLEHATGEWVTGVDSDDWVDTQTYEKAVACISPDVNMVCFGIVLEDTEDLPNLQAMQEHYRMKEVGVQELTHQLSLEMVVAFCNKLWRRSIIEQYGIRFPVGMLYEDVPFFFCCAAVAKMVCFLPASLYHYVQRPASIMGKTVKKTPRSIDHLLGLEHIYQFYNRHGILKKRVSAFVDLFHFCYEHTLWYVDDATLPTVHELACGLAQKTGIMNLIRPDIARELRHGTASPIVRFFVQRFRDRVSYGLGCFHLLTLSYQAGKVTWFLLGRRVASHPVY